MDTHFYISNNFVWDMSLGVFRPLRRLSYAAAMHCESANAQKKPNNVVWWADTAAESVKDLSVVFSASKWWQVSRQNGKHIWRVWDRPFRHELRAPQHQSPVCCSLVLGYSRSSRIFLKRYDAIQYNMFNMRAKNDESCVSDEADVPNRLCPNACRF